MKPLIGIPLRYSIEDDISIICISEPLRRSVQKLGGRVMPIAPVVDVDSTKTKLEDFPDITAENINDLNNFLEMCDGLILPGGNKFLPTDMYILDYAIKNNIPVLGICLSMQMMSCYQEDILMEKNDDTLLNHNQEKDKLFQHKVKIDHDSLLYQIIEKDEIEVNSFHNYHITPNHIYKSVAKSPDGVIEAIEYPNSTFNMGVQWHPERSIDKDEISKKLLKYFIEECRIYNKRKKDTTVVM